MLDAEKLQSTVSSRLFTLERQHDHARRAHTGTIAATFASDYKAEASEIRCLRWVLHQMEDCTC